MNYVKTIVSLILMSSPLIAMDKNTFANACMVYLAPSKTSLIQGGIVATQMAMSHPRIMPYVDDAKRFAYKASFIAPALVAYNSEAIKNEMMNQINQFSSNEHGKVTYPFNICLEKGIKNTLMYGGIAMAGYLFYTQTLEYLTKGKLDSIFKQLGKQARSLQKKALEVYQNTNTIQQTLNGLTAHCEQVKRSFEKLNQNLKQNQTQIITDLSVLQAAKEEHHQRVRDLETILNRVNIPALSQAVGKIEALWSENQNCLQSSINQIEQNEQEKQMQVKKILEEAVAKHRMRATAQRILIDGSMQDAEEFFVKVIQVANGIFAARDQIDAILKIADEVNDKLYELEGMSSISGSDQSEDQSEDEDFPRRAEGSGK